MGALHWKMALRRVRSNVLTTLFVMAAATFLLLYPGLIADAEEELETAYDQIEVSGWLINASGYEDPMIPVKTYDALLGTGMLGRYFAYSYVNFSMPDMALEALRLEPRYEEMSRDELLAALEMRLNNLTLGDASLLYGVSGTDAEPTLARLQGSITWLEGYSAADFAGEEAVCVLPEVSGLDLGEEAALILRRIEAGSFTERGEARMIARFKVIGLYGTAMSGSFGDGAVAYCPLGAMRSLLASDGFFRFAIRSFSFVLRDSRDVSRFKQALVGLSLDSDKSVRAAVDDRILQGTVAPIEKNIALLRGVQTLLFALVTGMGFLLCFLFARGRQPEFAVMRMLGENPLLLMFGTLAEQAVLCVCGAGLGTLPVLLITGGRDAIDWRILALFISCYLAGAAVAALLGAHGRPMMLLKGRE